MNDDITDSVSDTEPDTEHEPYWRGWTREVLLPGIGNALGFGLAVAIYLSMVPLLEAVIIHVVLDDEPSMTEINTSYIEAINDDPNGSSVLCVEERHGLTERIVTFLPVDELLGFFATKATGPEGGTFVQGGVPLAKDELVLTKDDARVFFDQEYEPLVC